MGIKGQIPWNKGLTKETDQRVKQYSETNKKIINRKPSKPRKYSKDPNDWKIKCGKCGYDMVYTHQGSYINALRKNEKNPNELIKCQTCHNYHKNTYNKNKYKNITLTEKKLIISQNAKKRWANYSAEERDAIFRKMLNNIMNRDPALREIQYKKVSEANKKRMLELKYENQFKPGYNKESINFIITVLNKRFNTEFRHAESTKGEFKVYDSINKCFYFADAYCEKLNIWIEIDEHPKFKNNKLRIHHIPKHYRIKELVKCNIIRFKMTKNYKTKQVLSIKEYYNDIINHGINLEEQIKFV